MNIEYINVLEEKRKKIVKGLWLEGYTINDLSVIFNKNIEDIKAMINGNA